MGSTTLCGEWKDRLYKIFLSQRSLVLLSSVYRRFLQVCDFKLTGYIVALYKYATLSCLDHPHDFAHRCSAGPPSSVPDETLQTLDCTRASWRVFCAVVAVASTFCTRVITCDDSGNRVLTVVPASTLCCTQNVHDKAACICSTYRVSA